MEGALAHGGRALALVPAQGLVRLFIFLSFNVCRSQKSSETVCHVILCRILCAVYVVTQRKTDPVQICFV